MAATGATLQPGLSTRVRPRATRLPYGWPLYALFGLFPLWWVLGLGAFIWPVMAAPMLLSLLARRTVRVPRGYGFYLLFMIWMMASALQLNGPDRMIGFVFRALLYSSVGITCLYVYNATKEQLPTRTIVRMMALFWGIVVAGGLLGIVAPELEFRTLAERLVPGRLLANDYVYTLVHPTTAQIQVFLGYPVPRPRAPFVYTNDWGGTYALLVPFVLAAWTQVRSLARRSILRLVAIVSLLPVVFSLNRILWLCLIVAIVYGSARFAIRGRTGGFQGILALGAVVFLIFTFGPTRQLIDDRVNTPHSNQGRTILYKEAADSVGKSPLLGYGAPRPSQSNPNLPSVGTQGQFWLVLFSHGVPGAIFFTSFLGYACWRTRKARTTTGLWCHIVIVLALIQMPFYGLLSAQLHIIAIAIALAAREEREPDLGETPEPAVTIVAAPTTNGRAVVGATNGHGNGNGSRSRV